MGRVTWLCAMNGDLSSLFTMSVVGRGWCIHVLVVRKTVLVTWMQQLPECLKTIAWSVLEGKGFHFSIWMGGLAALRTKSHCFMLVRGNGRKGHRTCLTVKFYKENLLLSPSKAQTCQRFADVELVSLSFSHPRNSARGAQRAIFSGSIYACAESSGLKERDGLLMSSS